MAQATQASRVKEEEELRGLFKQAESIREQIDVINDTILDIETVLETLAFIKEKGKDKTVLVPIGGGNFIRAKIIDTENVIMGVGGRLSIEAGIDEAREMLRDRVRVLEDLRLQLAKKLEEVNAKITELIEQIRKQQTTGSQAS